MEVEENGCDVSTEDDKIKLIFTSEENTCESIEEASEEIVSESPIENEISKMEVDDIKENKILKAKNDIEDDIRMICGSEELNRSSQDKEQSIDNNILETLQEQSSDQPTNIIEKTQRNEGGHPHPHHHHQQQTTINLKRTLSQNSTGTIKDGDSDQDLFGFYDGKFVFGKKIKINSNEIDSEIIGSKFKRILNDSEILEDVEEEEEINNTIEKIKQQNGKIDNSDKVSSQQNIIEQNLNISKVNNENDDNKILSTPVVSPSSSSSIQISYSSSTTTTATTPKLRPSEDPVYRKPFEMGWKREIVLRALPGSKDKGEVYYITPTGKKLRTRHEIQVNLTPGLALENFTFSKDPLGADPEDEIIRSAKPTGRSTEISTPRTPEMNTPTSGKRIPKPKGPKGASPPPQGWTSTQAVKTQGSRSHSRYSTNADDHFSKSSGRGLSSTSSDNNSSNNKSSNINKKGEPCTIQCVLAMGLIPQLQCIKCLCLYHHECVGLDRNIDDFQSGNANESGGGGGKGKKIYECDSCKAQSLTKTDLLSLNNPENLIDKSQKSNLNAQISQNNNNNNNNGNKLNNLGKSQLKISNNLNPKNNSDNRNYQEKDNSNKNINQGNNKNVISNKEIKSTSLSSINISPKHVQSIAVLNGRKYLVIHKPGIPSNEHSEQFTMTSNKSSPVKVQYVDSYVHNLFGNVSAAYDIILNVFKYLKVQELLRAACVSRLWNHLANERSLWKVVRMKNSQVNDWAGFAATLSRNSTQHLDLRKMICPKSGVDRMWTNFNDNIQKVFTLKTIDLGRCPASVVQNLFLATPQLNILNATSIKSETINLENLNKLSNLTELRLKSVERCNLVGDLSSFAFLKNLQHLSLTSINDLGTKNIEILGQLTELESLEIGECSTIQQNFGIEVLANLKKLQRLRLEESTEISVTFSILDQIAEMENLQQLELVNFDIRDGFEQKIISCKNLKRFLLIPTYVAQSATTNQIILSSMRKLKTLESFTWVVTLELLSVTALYVDQCGSRDRRNFNDCIPVLKPVPGASHKEKDEAPNKTTNADIQQIEILPLSTIKEILDDGTPNTNHKIVRVAFNTTWRQTFVE